MGQHRGHEDQKGDLPVYGLVSRHRLQHQIGAPVSLFVEDLMQEYDEESCKGHAEKEPGMEGAGLCCPLDQFYKGRSDEASRQSADH